MTLVDRLTRTLLYEGFVLYPYRADAIKNRQRFTFGALCPPDYCRDAGTDTSSLQTECLVESTNDTVLCVRARFLHLLSREVARPRGQQFDDSSSIESFEPVDSLMVDDKTYQAWEEAIEREVTLTGLRLDALARQPFCQPFGFPASRQSEPILTADSRKAGQITRRQNTLAGTVVVSSERIADALYRVRVQVANETPLDVAECANREQALMYALASTHTVLQLEHGKFVSLLDPGEGCRAAAEECRNIGAWPVLVGEPPQRDTVLSSPITLYDYPQIAPESPGDLCDGTEIDEILMLRILTLTDEEKRAMRALDPRSREMLDRTELLPEEQFMKMHGAIRGLRPAREAT